MTDCKIFEQCKITRYITWVNFTQNYLISTAAVPKCSTLHPKWKHLEHAAQFLTPQKQASETKTNRTSSGIQRYKAQHAADTKTLQRNAFPFTLVCCCWSLLRDMKRPVDLLLNLKHQTHTAIQKTPSYTLYVCDNFDTCKLTLAILSARINSNIKPLHNIPPNIKSVTSQICKIWMFNCIALQHSYSIQKCVNRPFSRGNFTFWIIPLWLICTQFYTASVQNVNQH